MFHNSQNCSNKDRNQIKISEATHDKINKVPTKLQKNIACLNINQANRSYKMLFVIRTLTKRLHNPLKTNIKQILQIILLILLIVAQEQSSHPKLSKKRVMLLKSIMMTAETRSAKIENSF